MVSVPFNITIYGKDGCPNCANAKIYCESQELTFEYKQLDTDFNKNFLKVNFPQARTFPVVVFNNTYIGGYRELIKEHKKALGYETD